MDTPAQVTPEGVETMPSGVSRGQFLRNAAKGGIVLATAGGVLASVEGAAFAASGKPTASDIKTLQAAYTAESLAVFLYSAILKDYAKFSKPKLKKENRSYFEAALKDEEAHKAFLAKALGSKTPKGLKFKIPASVTKSGESLLKTGAALETAFVEAYLGASNTLSSAELKLVAAKVASNEATHFSFFDAEAGGNAVLPAVPNTNTIPNTVKKLKPFLG
ncbi:MAG: ferritin-like domain-containing protein [Solirubrobacteraceae bacterium]